MSGGLRVVVTGATGNIGTSVVSALGDDPRVATVVGIARRRPEWSPPKLETATADLGTAPRERLDELFSGADVVIHLAWLFQPTHRVDVTWRANVLGSMRVFETVARCAVPALVHSSSVGAYSPGPGDQPVTEDWPTHGWPGAAYTREKAYLERVLDGFEAAHPQTRVVRIRPAFVFKKEAATEQRRLFAGPFLPARLVRSGSVPVLPDIAGLRLQAVHSLDAAQAFRLAALGTARGPFNVAADPVLDVPAIAAILGARTVSVPAWPVRTALAGAWAAHLVPASPGLFDAVLRLPLLDAGRARAELGWAPRHTATEAITDFLDGLRERAGLATPPLASSVPGGRLGELATGVGQAP